MGVKFSNNGHSTLAASISSSDTSLTVASGHGARFPSLSSGDYFFATLIDASNNLEIVKCTARSSDVLTISRGQESTTARAYAIGDRIELRVTAQGIEDATAIANDSITNAMMADDAIDTAQIADDAITAALIADNAVGAAALNVSGNGTSGQALISDGDGSFSWGLAGGVLGFDSAQSGDQDSWSIGNSLYAATRYIVSATTTSSTDIVQLNARMNWSCSDTDDEVGFSWVYRASGTSTWSRLTAQGAVGNQSGLQGSYGTVVGQHNGNTTNVLMGHQFGVMDIIWVPGSVGTWEFCPAIDGNSNTGSTMYNNRFAANNSGQTWDRRGSSTVTATVIAGGVRV